ncbi:DUF262 domain-containing protein [Agaribacterium sp. ZY112]|uniref:DUF262 domain-containing protein n=1 Tax=Agaribacterium sp. ZY112 TaxID=3233574 RepID=UPI0035262055
MASTKKENKTLESSATPSVIEEGYLYRALGFIKTNPLASSNRFKIWATNEFDDDALVKAICHEIAKSPFIDSVNNHYRITKEGQEWLHEISESQSIEPESNLIFEHDLEQSPNSTLTHPYEVSKLKMESKTLSVFQALRKIKKGEINLNPEFQRAFVWDETKKSRLIESMLIRIPLPAFYLDATDQVNWTVVDGLQRLSTLDAFCTKQNFALRDLEFLPDLDGMKFDDLPQNYQVLIEDDTNLIFYNLMPGTPTLAKYTIFSRVNTGGLQLTPQEVRHALNQGNSTKLLQTLSKRREFEKTTCGSIPNLRMADRELILRALSFSMLGVDVYKYHGEMDAFLIHAMEEMNSMNNNDLKKIENTFIESIQKVWAIFGKYAFRKYSEEGGRRGPINKALFEVWTVSVQDYDVNSLVNNKEKIKKSFRLLLNIDYDFVKSISSSTSSYRAVEKRFGEIKKLLKECTQ